MEDHDLHRWEDEGGNVPEKHSEDIPEPGDI